MSPLKQSNNIAARMGRWSASHWKTAVFGWLAFVVIAVAVGGAVGTKKIDQQRRERRPGPPGRPDPQAGRLPGRPADGDRARPEQEAHDRATRPSARRSTTRRHGRSRSRRSQNLRSPLDPAHADQVSADGHTAMVEFDMKGNADGRREAHRRDHRRDRQDRRPPSRLLRRRGRLDQLRQGAQRGVQPAARAGRRAVDPADADRAAARLRRARRRRAAAAARALRRHRHDRPGRAAEPPRPDGSERQRRRPARRPRRRRRLLALLPQARA